MRAALALLLLMLCSSCGGEAEPARDGLWLATTIDGHEVAPTRFLIRVRGGRVVGGRDGCNSWAFDATRPPAADGTRTIVSDLMGCPGIPHRDAYWRALGNGNAVPSLTDDRRLRVGAGGHEIVARSEPE